MAKQSFWERVGRGVGYGWQRAKELGAQLEEQARQGADSAEGEKLRELYEKLGRLVAQHALDEGQPSFDPGSPEATEIIEAIRTEQERLEREAEENGEGGPGKRGKPGDGG